MSQVTPGEIVAYRTTLLEVIGLLSKDTGAVQLVMPKSSLGLNDSATMGSTSSSRARAAVLESLPTAGPEIKFPYSLAVKQATAKPWVKLYTAASLGPRPSLTLPLAPHTPQPTVAQRPAPPVPL